MGQSTNARFEPLARLCSACLNCEDVLRTAATLVESRTLRERLAEHARIWSDAASRMQSLATDWGAPVHDQPGVAAVLRRARMRVKSAVNDERAIIEECGGRVAAALGEFEAVLGPEFGKDLQPDLHATYRRLAGLNKLI